MRKLNGETVRIIMAVMATDNCIQIGILTLVILFKAVLLFFSISSSIFSDKEDTDIL